MSELQHITAEFKNENQMVHMLPLSKLLNNEGQIEGLPRNPRFCRDDKFDKLLMSIEEDPEMLILKELWVVPFGEKYVVIAGNMRFRAAKQLGYSKLPCKVIPEHVSAEKLRAFAIKDNISYGTDNFEALATDWDFDELTHWGLEMPFPTGEPETNEPIDREGTTIKLEYTFDDYIRVKEQLALIANTPEMAVWKLLGNE